MFVYLPRTMIELFCMERITAMSDKMKNVWEAALTLTPDERAELAGRLLDTLDETDPNIDQAAIDAAWGAEADRRYQAYKRGEIGSVPVEELREMLKRRMNP